jgi:hypothetical protein
MSVRRPPEAAKHGYFETIANAAKGATSQAGSMAKMGADIMQSQFLKATDAVGLKEQVEAAEKYAKKIAARGHNDANRALNKAHRMARIFDLDEEEASLDSSDYDLLLSATGAKEQTITAYGNYSDTFFVPAGSTMVWKVRVKSIDIGFSVREVREEDPSPVVIEPLQRYTSEALIQSSLPPALHPRTINLYFDNSHSPLQKKTIVYWVNIGEKVSLADDQLGAARSKEVDAANTGPE